ncbi:TerB family tellurite resistance protein [Shewanella sp. MBTL60-007]|uniref:TerB family tellurite resistance protein n=1 Tax=Shewanella sp. MBTL60-007 TaxID=2815911 RepID=UPI001C7E5B4A|nr:TerB family tellurite resistance protein [Shewanella sp. MBTL60-007]
MFINQLSKNEKQALMSLLVDISKADGNLADSEINFLTAYAEENNIELNLSETPSISEVCNKIESKKGKVVAIQEIIKLAIVDGNYDDSERSGAMTISELLKLPLSKFEEIESWVLDGEHWVNRGIQMLADAGFSMPNEM